MGEKFDNVDISLTRLIPEELYYTVIMNTAAKEYVIDKGHICCHKCSL